MMLLGEVRSDMALELLEQKRCALLPPTLVTNRVLDLDLVEDGAVVELDEERVADGALRGVVVVDAEALVLDAEDLGPECVDARVRGGFVGAGRWLGRSVFMQEEVY